MGAASSRPAPIRIGLFGGSFNPIHVGHLLLAETARDLLSLDRVIFMPAGQPPHKRGAKLLDGQTRLKLIELAIRQSPHFVASDYEISQPGTSYTVETMRMLKDRMPAARWHLLVGQDMLSVTWAGWAELKRLCTIVAVRRPECPAPRRERGIRWIEMPQVEISSSEIRHRLAAGRSITYLVPESVERFLKEHRVYQKDGTAGTA